MSKQVVLLRVGIDSGSGGIQGPLFNDGTFEFICIPDKKRVSAHTYGNMVGQDGRPHASYFSEPRRKLMAAQHVHVDPEWDSFSYGDPTTPKRSLRNLKPGDLLVFYCGLQKWDTAGGWDREHRPALYLAGFFEVAVAGMAGDFDQKVLKTEFSKNFHVQRGGGPGRQAAQSAFSGNADGVRECRGPRFHSTKPASLGGVWVR